MRQQLLSGAGRPFAPRYLRLAIVSLLLIASALPEVRGRGASERVGHEASIVGPPVSSALGSTDDSPGLHERTFWSNALGREMPYSVYLPPGYDPTSPRRYPVLYMLHGLGGNHLEEWTGYGLIDTATALIASGELPPMIIVLPEGEDGYWVDHVDGGPAWGTYVARDLVAEVDGRLETIATPGARAIGGNSMGAHGAIQLAMNFPGEFGVVGAHSPTLRTFGDAPAYFGDRASFEARDPLALVEAHVDIARSLRIWIDVGDQDPWQPAAAALDDVLLGGGVPHQFEVLSGAHDDAYWSAHIREYLRFYGTALAAGS